MRPLLDGFECRCLPDHEFAGGISDRLVAFLGPPDDQEGKCGERERAEAALEHRRTTVVPSSHGRDATVIGQRLVLKFGQSSSIAPPKPINQNYAAPDSSAPTRPRNQGIKGSIAPARNAGEKYARDPSAVVARPISLASDPVAAGPTRGPRARVRLIEEVNAGSGAGDQMLYRQVGPRRLAQSLFCSLMLLHIDETGLRF